MSYKDIQRLFEQERSVDVIKSDTAVSITEDLESLNYVDQRNKDKNRYVPNIEYDKPEKFAFYGDAEEYYKYSFEYIRRTYPYDGSLYEKQQWHNDASDLDNYIYENKYPRTTGYINFSMGPDGWGSRTATASGSGGGHTVGGQLGQPSVQEYVFIKGGPNPAPDGDFKSIDSRANKYNEYLRRSTNLDINFDRGVTVEFWYKGPEDAWPTGTSTSHTPVIFDLWNGVTGSSQSYGRFTILFKNFIGSTTGHAAFAINCVSGSRQAQGIRGFDISSSAFSPDKYAFTSLVTASVLDNNWHHYAFVTKNNANDLYCTLYVDGNLKQTLTGSGQAMGPITLAEGPTVSGMNATIGSSIAHPWADTTFEPGTAASPNGQGWNKVSGSIDEFRFWKIARSAKQIGRNWFSQIGGGTNTDTSNIDLGVYYKFNEGNTGNDTQDVVVLDYSGRISNGNFVGYTGSYGQRNLGSALDDAGYTEPKDPIIYTSHPQYISIKQELMNSGSLWNNQNANSIHSFFPEWVLADDEFKGDLNLKRFSQTLASYLDELTILIQKLPRLRDVEYLSGSHKPMPFSNKKLESMGFSTYDLFRDAEKIERFLDRNEQENFEDKVHNIKNFIYDNVYNNLTSIFKSKGNEKSLKQLLHTIGIDEDIFKINLYASDLTYELSDNYNYVSRKRKLLDFNKAENNFGTVYQTSSYNSAYSYISGSPGPGPSGLITTPRTYEVNVLFSEQEAVSIPPYKHFQQVSSSIFGAHTQQKSNWTNPTVMTWDETDPANFQVYAVREQVNSSKAKFVMTTTNGGLLVGKVPNASSTFNGLAALNADNGTTITLTNADGSTHSINTNSSLLYSAYGWAAIGTQTISSTAHATQALHNAFRYAISTGDLKMTLTPASYTSETEITLTQNIEGSDGNTSITLPANIIANGTTGAGTGVFTGGGTTERHVLESDYFEIYDNEKWNLSVAIRPTEIEVADRVVSGTTGHGADENYTVEFRGFNTKAEIVENFFILSGTIPTTYGVNALTSSTRIYAGSHYTNFTGSLREKSDVKMANARVWLKYLENKELVYHARDIENYGTIDAYRNNSLNNTAMQNQYLHNFDTLALNWEFSNLSTSDASGEFLVNDVTTGSSDRFADKASLGDVLYRGHDGLGANFPASSENIFDVNYIPVAKQRLPEVLNDIDMISILTEDDENFPSERALPIRYLLAIEKSMYQTISEEMINVFATVKEFNNVIGHPVNRYRQEYKALGKLRQMFFDKVENVPDIEKYVEFFKWFDSSINRMMQQLIPASTWQISGVGDTIESHVFERNKYWNKFPTLENKFPPIQGQILGINEHLYEYDCGYPIPRKAASRNILKILGDLADDDRLTVNVPTTAGGAGYDITIRIVADADDGTTNEVQVTRTGTTNTRNRIALAISGLDSTVVKYGAGSGDVTNGIAGITAVGSNNDTIIVTATQPGAVGNEIVFTDVEGTMVAAGSVGSSPASLAGGTGGLEDGNCLWWKDRAQRDAWPLASGDSNVDSDKEQIRKVLTTEITSSAPTLVNSDGSTYYGSTYVIRNLSKPYKFGFDRRKIIHGGPNGDDNQRKYDYLTPIIRSFGDNTDWLNISLDIPDSASYCVCAPDVAEKRRLQFTTIRYENSQEVPYQKGKGDLFAPFTIFSSSATWGYKSAAMNAWGLDFNDIHHDVYGDDYEIPMQSPFTEKNVGGKQVRHHNINIDLHDSEDNRGEFYNVLGDGTGLNYHSPDRPGSHKARSVYFRDETAKRPVNIRNIHTTGALGSPSGTLGTVGGNYLMPYEVVQITGRDSNNMFLRDLFNYGSIQDGVAMLPWWFRQLEAPSAAISGVVDHNLFGRSGSLDEFGNLRRNKIVFAERFSAPGGPECLSRGYLDDTSETYSVYNTMNYRNQNVRQALDTLWTIHSNKFGIASIDTEVQAAGNVLVMPGDQVDNDRFIVNIPTTMGGAGYDITIRIVADADDGTANEVQVTRTSPTNTRNRVVLAILGLDSSVVKYGAGSGDVISGIAGIGAIAGAGDTIYVYASSNGVDGNKITFRDIEGTAVSDSPAGGLPLQPVTLTGGDSESPSYHKIFGNSMQRLELSTDTAVSSDALYSGVGITASHDNMWVTHHIPRSDYQYSWITASVNRTIRNAAQETERALIERLTGHAPASGYISGSFEAGWNIISGTSHFVPAITFMSAGKGPILGIGAKNDAYTDNLPGSTYYDDARNQGRGDPLWHPFISLNMITSEPIATASTFTETFGDERGTFTYVYKNLTGYAVSGPPKSPYTQNPDPVLDYPGLTAYVPARPSYFNNTILVSTTAELGDNIFDPQQVAHNLIPENVGGTAPQSQKGGGILFNGLMHERSGPYGWCTWKQLRGEQRPLAKYFRKNNIISLITKAPLIGLDVQAQRDGGLKPWVRAGDRRIDHVTEPPLASRYKPFNQYLDLVTEFAGQPGGPSPGILTNKETVKLRYTHGNNQSSFASNKLNNILNTWNRSKQLYHDIRKYYYYPAGDIPSNANPLDTMIRLDYKEVLFPREKYIYLNETRARTQFDVVFWKDTRISEYRAFTDAPRYITGAMDYRGLTRNHWWDHLVKGRTAYTYSGSVAYDTDTVIAIQNSHLHQTNSLGAVITLQSGSHGYVPAANGSIWPLDARAQFERTDGKGYCLIMTSSGGSKISSSAGYTTAYTIAQRISGGMSGLDGAGELQNDYSLFHNGDLIQSGTGVGAHTNEHYTYLRGTSGQSAGLRAGCLYNRRVEETMSDGAVVFSGDTLWQAGEQMNMENVIDRYSHAKCAGPFYDSYDTWFEDLRAAGKGYSIIPEYRMSEHMLYYINLGKFPSKREDEPKNWLTLTGGNIPDISYRNDTNLSEDFVASYSTTDFLKYFRVLEEDHVGTHYPSHIRLSCKTLKKFLPYDGFYPASRTLQLATLFSQSYGSELEYSSSAGHFRTAVTPFFAPGILYNTIKSGIAVDYPIMTRKALFTTGSAANGTEDKGIPRIEKVSGSGNTESFNYDYRLPFDALYQPAYYLGSQNGILDTEPHHSAALPPIAPETSKLRAQLDSRVSFKKCSDISKPQYQMAMNNFLSTIPWFFLKDSKLSNFISKPANLWDQFDSTAVYRMYVVLSKGNSPDPIKVSDVFNPYDYGAWANGVLQPGNAPGDSGIKLPGLTPFQVLESTNFYGSTMRMYDRFGAHVRDRSGEPAAEHNGKYNFYGSSFGPPVAISSSYSGSALGYPSSASYAPYTPPYYHGQAIAVIDYFPPGVGEQLDVYTVPEIFNDPHLRVTYLRELECPLMTHDWGGNIWDLTLGTNNRSMAAHNAMQISASVNLFGQVLNYKKAQYSQLGTIVGYEEVEYPKDVTSWVIETKFECPVMHFGGPDRGVEGRHHHHDYTDHDNEITLPISGSGSVAAGMWHQYSTDTGGRLLTKDDVDNPARLNNPSYIASQQRQITLSLLSGDHFRPEGMVADTDELKTKGVPLSSLPGSLLDDKYTNPHTGARVTHLKDLAKHIGMSKDKLLLPSEVDKLKDIFKDIMKWTAKKENPGAFVESDTTGASAADILDNATKALNNLLPTAESMVEDYIIGDHVTRRHKIGDIAESKIVREAILAIPFTTTEHSTMQRYTFPDEWVKYALSDDLGELPGDEGVNWEDGGQIIPSITVVNQILTMNKYVIPPHLDFINNNVQPCVMYIFEFLHNLDKKDLMHIWQNLPPKSLMDIGEPTETVAGIDHPLFVNDFFGVSAGAKTYNFPKSDIRWEIFKVKQRSPNFYPDMTLDATDNILPDATAPPTGTGKSLKLGRTWSPVKAGMADIPSYGYNWPFDFFTMLELVRLEGGISLTPGSRPKSNFIDWKLPEPEVVETKPFPPPEEPPPDPIPEDAPPEVEWIDIIYDGETTEIGADGKTRTKKPPPGMRNEVFNDPLWDPLMRDMISEKKGKEMQEMDRKRAEKGSQEGRKKADLETFEFYGRDEAGQTQRDKSGNDGVSGTDDTGKLSDAGFDDSGGEKWSEKSAAAFDEKGEALALLAELAKKDEGPDVA